MHNLTKIKLFRVVLWLSSPIAFVLIFPFAFLRRKKKSGLFFFFDRYAIGGAQHVYLDILESVSDRYKVIYFTRKSANSKMKEFFYNFRNTECHDIHLWCDNLLFRIFSTYFFAFYVNRHANAVVLGSNSTFFYDMLPFLKRSVKKIELLHNFSYGKKGMEYFGLANHRYLDYRMVIDEFTKQNILRQYIEHQVSPEYGERVVLCEYGVTIPPRVLKSSVPPLKVLYAGRGTRQKRVWLLNKIAEHFFSDDRVVFGFAGPLDDELTNAVKNKYHVYGEVGDRTIMNKLFAEYHVVILTSAFEGFPVVIKEGMSFGCVPVVTALPSNRTHLIHDDNALLINEFEDEQKVIAGGITLLTYLINHPEELQRISSNAYEYAKQNFGKTEFLTTYRNLIG